MGLFGDLFGGGKKPDIGAMYPDYPQLKVDDAGLYLNQIDGLVKQYEDISTGNSMFDAVKFMYEPQKQLIDAQYGIGGPSGDVFSSKTGALADLQAGLNKRGLLDAGTSGLLESQLYANRARDLANIFGQAKQVQKSDFDNSLVQLQGLYPQRFDVRNIPNAVDYFNAVNQYNHVTAPVASAQGMYNASQGAKTFLGQVIPQLAQAAGGYFAGPYGAQAAGSIFTGAGGTGGGRPQVSPNLFNQTQTNNNTGYSPSNFAFTQGNVGNPFATVGGRYSPQFQAQPQTQKSEVLNQNSGSSASFASMLKQLLSNMQMPQG